MTAVTLSQAKTHLNIDATDTGDDTELQFFTDVANDWIAKVVTDTTPTPVTMGTLELIRHLWDSQRGAFETPLTGDDFSLGLAGFSIPNRVLELIRPWLLPQYQPGAKINATPLVACPGRFPDDGWPDPTDRLIVW